MSILQKELLCEFSAYAIDKSNKDWCSVRNQEVDRHPDDYHYFWIYDPDTFSVEKWDAESIDGLVKEIQPSRKCLEELVKKIPPSREFIDDLVKEIRPSRETVEYLSESYDEDDRKSEKEWWKRKWQAVKSIPKRIEGSIGKYPRLLWLILTLGMFLVGIGSLIVTYSKD